MFVLPGIVVALFVHQSNVSLRFLLRIFLGLLRVGLVASSNHNDQRIAGRAF